MSEGETRPSYTGPITIGMHFEFEPDRPHMHERVIVSRIADGHIWAIGVRSGELWNDEPTFRKKVVPAVPPKA